MVMAVIGLDALIFLGLGAVMLYDPAGLMASVGVGVTGPGGVTELRAMYGGLEIGLGIFCLMGLWRPDWRAPVLTACLLVLAGLGSARLGGMMVSGSTPLLIKLLISEVISVVINAGALYAVVRGSGG